MFQTLNEARMACFLDKDCSTIVDYKCDRRFYYLCQEYSTIKPSKSSCVYSRPIEAGNNLHHSTLKSKKYLIQPSLIAVTSMFHDTLHLFIYIRFNPEPQRN